MTEKQLKIVQAALKLFAEEGYNATSTSKVAKEAGVSEGLIFRHFKNKEGLLEAIMEQGREQVNEINKTLFQLEDPRELIRAALSYPFHMEQSNYHFWRLLYALKWKADVYDSSISDPLRQELIKAFTKLGYENPEAEAHTILILIDGIAVAVLLRRPANQEAILQAILDKYNL